MGLIRPSALWLGLVLAAPALWRGFVTGEVDVISALTRFVLGVLVSAVMLAGLRAVTAAYRHGHPAPVPAPVPAPGLREEDRTGRG